MFPACLGIKYLPFFCAIFFDCDLSRDSGANKTKALESARRFSLRVWTWNGEILTHGTLQSHKDSLAITTLKKILLCLCEGLKSLCWFPFDSSSARYEEAPCEYHVANCVQAGKKENSNHGESFFLGTVRAQVSIECLMNQHHNLWNWIYFPPDRIGSFFCYVHEERRIVPFMGSSRAHPE